MTPGPKEQVSAEEYEFEDPYNDADDYDEFQDNEGFDLDKDPERAGESASEGDSDGDFDSEDFGGDDFEERDDSEQG